MNNSAIFARSRSINDINDCWFYHTIELPDHGLIIGQWDLRKNTSNYLGNVSFEGKRVFELGTANGFLCMEMERRGAEVTCYDLSENDAWDIVPYDGLDIPAIITSKKRHINQLNNAWWFVHNALGLKAKIIYGSVYNIPVNIGDFDITTFGSILLHLRDPFLAMQKAAAITKETMIITDLLGPATGGSLSRKLKNVIETSINKPLFKRSPITFIPDPEKKFPLDTWWYLSPEIITRFCKILGFNNIRLLLHRQKFEPTNRNVNVFTIVANRKPIS